MEEDDDRHQPAAWLWNVMTVKTSQSKHYHHHTENYPASVSQKYIKRQTPVKENR